MAYISVYDIQQTLDAQLQTVPGLPILYEENIFAQQTGTTPFCRSTLLPAKSTLESIGTNNPVVKQTGLYQIDLFYPVEYGYAAQAQMIDAVVNVFPPGKLTLQGGQQLIIFTAWSQPGHNDQSAFLQKPILVEWCIWYPV